jgi:predicted O-linked N-acetylglucosamine transferase (SPINDLY family)
LFDEYPKKSVHGISKQQVPILFDNLILLAFVMNICQMVLYDPARVLASFSGSPHIPPADDY